MTRFWIFWQTPRARGMRTVDLQNVEILAGFCPVDRMWEELAADTGAVFPTEEKYAVVMRREMLCTAA